MESIPIDYTMFYLILSNLLSTYFNEADKNILGLILEMCLRLVLYIFLMVANLCPLRTDLISGKL